MCKCICIDKIIVDIVELNMSMFLPQFNIKINVILEETNSKY